MPATARNSAGADHRLVRRLSPEDLSILALETETVAGHTCKVIVLDASIDPELLRASIAARLHRAPPLCMRLCEIDGEPWWAAEPRLDLRAHVVVLDASEPPDMAALRAIVARRFEERLDRSAPLWRIDVIPGLAAGGSALIWRIHHALADGATAMRVARAALWDEQLSGAARPVRSQPPRASERIDRVVHRRHSVLMAAAREAPQPWLRSPFDGHIDARRSVAFATVELEGLRRVARATEGATVNDAVLTVLAGGLRRWLESRHGHFDTVRVKVPVSLHDLSVNSSDELAEPGNHDSFFCLDLPLGSADPLDRLRAVRRATRVRKQSHDAEQLDALMRQLGRIPRLQHFAERALAHPRSFALNVSNVPGPRDPVHVLGASVRALYTIAEIREHHALRVAVTSLVDTLSFGLSADPTLLPDVDRLAQHIQTESAALIARLDVV
jgi:WS/DGAT/MGAT family acyltransferase